MADLKTTPNRNSVSAFQATIDDPRKRSDCKAIGAMMRAATGSRPVMWGDAMVGYGRYHYVYSSGREGDWFVTGYSPRKSSISIYLMAGFEGMDALMKRLGRHKTGKCCLYVKTLGDIDTDILARMLDISVETIARRYPAT